MKSILLIGLNTFGIQLAKNFRELGHHVMAVDRDEARVNAILPYVTDAQIGDSTNEHFLKSLGVNNYDVCVVSIGNDFQNSLETTSLLKELGGKLVVSVAEREVQGKFLLRNGADEVINPEKQITEWAAIRYGSKHILDYIKLDADHAIFEVEIPSDWSGLTVGQIDIRKKYGINILAVKTNGNMNMSITPETVLSSEKTLLVLGEHKSVRKCFKI
ncbi:MAG: TrkA family potassium uptake protein [Butyrivibrio sp.]|nr:TrkA family potassium uptake protein [Butyrivibrio sp.]